MAAFLTAGTTEAASSTFTLAAGESTLLYLIDAGGPGLPEDILVDIQVSSSATEYFNIGFLSRERPALVLTAPGTFRVLRRACSTAVGVDKN
jgi:hypothetical protein